MKEKIIGDIIKIIEEIDDLKLLNFIYIYIKRVKSKY